MRIGSFGSHILDLAKSTEHVHQLEMIARVSERVVDVQSTGALVYVIIFSSIESKGSIPATRHARGVALDLQLSSRERRIEVYCSFSPHSCYLFVFPSSSLHHPGPLMATLAPLVTVTIICRRFGVELDERIDTHDADAGLDG